MLNLKQNWFESAPWTKVVSVNQELCQKDSQPHGPKSPGYDAAMKLWEESARQNGNLRTALDVCRQVHKLAPFLFFNGNTVAAVAKLMVDEAVRPLPPVQAQIARSTVSHYVVGAIKADELEGVFKHFGDRWRNAAPVASAVPASPTTH